ncbi:MAG: hypothetical protein J7647_31970 [Cyanobacteria bacterium SBLK]|nr:hypothetical protein [Cyanobacteria bacterium SBLK]
MVVSKIKRFFANGEAAKTFRELAKTLKILFVVGVCVVMMAGVANATEMSKYEGDMKLAPLGTAPEEFVAVRPGGNIKAQCQSFCIEKQSCVAIYFREGESRCYYYNNYGFSLKSATGYDTTFKIWTD